MATTKVSRSIPTGIGWKSPFEFSPAPSAGLIGAQVSNQEKQPPSLQPLTETTRAIVKDYFRLLGSGAEPDAIASLFSEVIDWDIPGDAARISWLGTRSKRAEVSDFIRDLRAKTIPIRFEMDSMIAEGENAVAFGRLETQVKSTGKTIRSEFAFHFTVHEGRISRFRLFEDSYAVAQALS